MKLGYFSQENEAMDESLKVIDYIRNAAEYVQTKDGSVSASHDAGAFPVPIQRAVHHHWTAYLAVRSGVCTCCVS